MILSLGEAFLLLIKQVRNTTLRLLSMGTLESLMKIIVPPLMLRDGLNMWAMWLLRVGVGIHIKKINFTGMNFA